MRALHFRQPGGIRVIIAPLVGLSLVIGVATGSPLDPATPVAIDKSPRQKHVAMQPLLRSATECIARAVAADPRVSRQEANLGDLIVDSMPTCITPVRALIDAHDSYYGPGTGEAFFIGPYLDALPTAVDKWVKDLVR
jgi:hypothetical protein